MNSKGYSVGFTWVFGLVTIFGLGLLYIVFNQVFEAHLVPIILNQTNSTITNNATVVLINNNVDKFMDFFHTMPFVLFFVTVIYMIIAAIRREKEDAYL